MSLKLVELRPDRALLDPNFGGYKLSLETIPILRETLPVRVDTVLPSNDQYSFLHAKLFGFHNHLTGEIQGESGAVYFFDEEWQVQKAFLDDVTGSLELLQLWVVPNRERSDGDYNFSLKFAKNLAVVSDGTGMLYVLNVGNGESQWQLIFSDEVIQQRYIVQDAVYLGDKLHCLLFSVRQNEESKKFNSVLHWVTLAKAADKAWGIIALRELECSGDCYYACFEPTCDAIYIVSDDGCKFTVDSENPIEAKREAKKYQWFQTYEDITLKFNIGENTRKDDLQINVEDLEVEIKHKEEILLKGKLCKKVKAGLTTWSADHKLLKVLLIKEEAGNMWTEVVENDCSGEHLLDPNLVTEAHQKLQGLCSDTMILEGQTEQGPIFSRQQIEECDFDDEKVACFERLACVTHDVTHRCSLGSQHVLLTCSLSDDLPPSIGVRYDVDACLWQPLYNDGDFTLKHEATLLAFGYIQASKQHKKFIAAPPDLNYSVICESNRHVFIYRQRKPTTNTELRNRTTGKRFQTIAQQQVVNAGEDDILGLFATNSTLFLLTEKKIMALQL